MATKKSSSIQSSVEQADSSRRERTLSKLIGLLATPAMGACLFVFIWALINEVWPNKEVPPLDLEKMRQIVGFYVTMNIALVGLIPVVISNLRDRVERSHVVKKRKETRIFGGIIDGFCPSVFVWSVILFVADLIWTAMPCDIFFWAISCLEIAMLIVYVLFFVVTTQSNWPETFLKNKQIAEVSGTRCKDGI